MADIHELLIYVPELNNRVHFLFRQVFSRIIGIRTIFTNDKEEFINSNAAKLNYSNQRFANELYIRPHGLLFEKGVHPISIKVHKYKELPIFFLSHGDSDFHFDIFSAIFYLITRYEEYLPYSPDRHGRFQPRESLSFEYKFIEEPIVELWIVVFKDFLKVKFPEMEFASCHFHYIPTIDVDTAFAFKNKGFPLGIALLVRDFFTAKFINFFKRSFTMLRLIKDPYDTFDFLENCLKNSKYKPIFFFLTGNRGKFDKNNSIRSKSMRLLIARISKFANIGFHPSYASNAKYKILENEKNRFEEAIENKVIRSRQHFIRMRLPKTFQNLVKLGIHEEYSVGWASLNGFRAGTCTPYHFYDLLRDKETNMMIFPFQAMDATFKTYLKLTPAEAEKELIALFEKVKKVNGTFIVIWHNDTFEPTIEGKEWRKVFENLLKTDS
jgi:hypothetical protein